MELDPLNCVECNLHKVQGCTEVDNCSFPVLSQLHPQALVHHPPEGHHEGDIELKLLGNKLLKLLQATKHSINLDPNLGLHHFKTMQYLVPLQNHLVSTSMVSLYRDMLGLQEYTEVRPHLHQVSQDAVEGQLQVK